MAQISKTTKIRWAIYTRKSTEEGLEQAFNSLDAQYEACEAYITSQRHEGWRLVENRYDDGAISGGTMERPGLQALLEDIEAGRIDMILVYKIDRLTRSLMDFSKIIERLDKHHASFVSVTQSFNTATSMGRLTLNMLLSFTQFEREVTAARIRDKIAASKTKGLWMGGTPPLGYKSNADQNTRCLIIDKDGAIYNILTNPFYIGKIKHRTLLYEGIHEPIIDLELWQSVQDKLKAGSMRKRQGAQQDANKQQNQAMAPKLLRSKLYDDTGDGLTPTYTIKAKKIIGYYISNRLLKQKDPKAWRLPAKSFEPMMIKAYKDSTRQWGNTIIHASHPSAQVNAPSIHVLKTKTQMLDHYLAKHDEELVAAIQRIDLKHDAITIKVQPTILQKALTLDIHPAKPLILTIPMTIKKRGVEQKLIIGNALPKPDQTLITALAKAHYWLSCIKKGETLTTIAVQEKVTDSYIRSRVLLAFLSPKIQKAIITGTQSIDLSLVKLIRNPIPLDWKKQEQFFLTGHNQALS